MGSDYFYVTVYESNQRQLFQSWHGIGLFPCHRLRLQSASTLEKLAWDRIISMLPFTSPISVNFSKVGLGSDYFHVTVYESNQRQLWKVGMGSDYFHVTVLRLQSASTLEKLAWDRIISMSPFTTPISVNVGKVGRTAVVK
jgi:hypothetical protein